MSDFRFKEVWEGLGEGGRTMALSGQSRSPEGAALTLNKCSALEWAWMAPLGTASCPPTPQPQSPHTESPHTECPSEQLKEHQQLPSVPQKLSLRQGPPLGPRYPAPLPLEDSGVHSRHPPLPQPKGCTLCVGARGRCRGGGERSGSGCTKPALSSSP